MEGRWESLQDQTLSGGGAAPKASDALSFLCGVRGGGRGRHRHRKLPVLDGHGNSQQVHGARWAPSVRSLPARRLFYTHARGVSLRSFGSRVRKSPAGAGGESLSLLIKVLEVKRLNLQLGH